jgi:hypothetical protein
MISEPMEPVNLRKMKEDHWFGHKYLAVSYYDERLTDEGRRMVLAIGEMLYAENNKNGSVL